MISSDFRTIARKNLDGKWSKSVWMLLAYLLVFFLIYFIQAIFPAPFNFLLSIVILIIEIPLGFGLVMSFVKLYNSEEVYAFDFWNFGFKYFSKSWGITGYIFLKLLVPFILLVISYVLMSFGVIGGSISIILYSSSSGFIFLTFIGAILAIISAIWGATKSFYYLLSYIIAAENENLSAKEVVEESKRLMTGKRAKLFILQLSFIGWAILCVLTFGIGYLWLLPYIQFANIAFYKSLKDDAFEAEVVSEDDNPIK